MVLHCRLRSLQRSVSSTEKVNIASGYYMACTSKSKEDVGLSIQKIMFPVKRPVDYERADWGLLFSFLIFNFF